MASADDHFMTETRTKPFILREFVECYKLPVCAKVVGCRGQELRSSSIRCGDYIHLETLAVDSISLSFYDADTGSKRVVRVPADSNVKFNVISTSSGSENSDVIMPTVADVMEACPMKFRANIENDDPYLPVIFKKGEEFRYLRKCRCPSDGTVYLECEDASGNIIQLPKTCKGNFSVIEDKTSYCLREIIAFGSVSRKLKLSSDNIKLLPIDDNDSIIDPENPLYTNLNEGDTLTRITGLPLTFNGVISMQAPDLFLLASAKNNLSDKLRIPLDLNIDLILAPNEEYEEPTIKERILYEFISDFEQDLPLVATISGYKNIPKEFRKVLSKNSDVLVHHVETSEKILASSKGSNFCIGKGMNGRFRRALMRFKSLSELLTLDRVVMVKIMEDVASDVPEPFLLKVGDLLKFENHTVQTIKIKYSKTNHVKCDTILCEKIATDKNKQLRLPIDLEVSMIEILPPNEQDGDDINYIFSRRTEFPLMVDFLPIHHCAQQVLPYDSELVLKSRVSDPLVLISPLPPEKDRRVSALDAKVDTCLLVPVRHKLYLKVKSKLNFPSSYFRLPRKVEWLDLEAEKITKDDYDRLLKYNDQAYEDYDPRSRSYQEEERQIEMNDSSKYKRSILRRKGASMTTLPQLKRHSKIFTKKDKKYSSEGNLANTTKDDEDDSEQDTEEERIYELYEAPYRKDKADKKTSKTLKSKLLKKLSLRRKKKEPNE